VHVGCFAFTPTRNLIDMPAARSDFVGLVEVLRACDETLDRLAARDDDLARALAERVRVRRRIAARRLLALSAAVRLGPRQPG
jgi:hypothetical protein